MTKEEAKKRLSEVEKQISTINETLENLKNEQRDLQEFLEKTETEEITREYLNAIYQISNDNSMKVKLYDDTETTPIMDHFFHSDKMFLIFENLYFVDTPSSNNRYGTRISLVVRKSKTGFRSKNDGLTMTDLKKSYGLYVRDYGGRHDRKTSLINEILSAVSKPSTEEGIYAFETPVRLGGQIYADQTGFGSEYYGKDLIVQGKLYGETTSFYIIGFIMED